MTLEISEEEFEATNDYWRTLHSDEKENISIRFGATSAQLREWCQRSVLPLELTDYVVNQRRLGALT